MGVTRLSILGGCAALALAVSASAAPVSLVSPESVGLSAPVEKATHCPRRHLRRAARCCEYYGAAVPVVSEPVVVEEPAYFGYAAPVVVEEPVGFYGYAAPVASVELGYYGYSAPVEVVVPSGNYCATSVRTCLLREPGVLGTGCSCHIPGGIARGLVE
jgi:hypothetical protein